MQEKLVLTTLTPDDLKQLIRETVSLLLSEQIPGSQNQPDEVMSVEEAAKFLSISVPTVYSKSSKGTLPVFKPEGSKNILFLRSELIEYIKSGRKFNNTNSQ